MAKKTGKPIVLAKAKAKAKNKATGPEKKKAARLDPKPVPPPHAGVDALVLDRLWGTILTRKDSDPGLSHSARLLSRGTAKIAQKFGEEAVECLIEAVAGHRMALIGESADVLYHLLVLWVDAGLRPEQIWAELARREGVSGIVEKAARKPVYAALATTKIP